MTPRLIFIALVSFFSYAYSESDNIYEVPCKSSNMTIEAVDISDKTTIHLNNRTAWTCKYKDLFDGPYGWQLGDRINIVYVYSEGYYLENASCQGCVPVELQNANSEGLEVNTIAEIIKNEKKSTNTIVLDNGTRWFIGSWSSGWMKDWQAGDRIIVTAQEFVFGKADHLLLNLDRKKNAPKNVRAQLKYTPETIVLEDTNKRETRDWKISIRSTWHENDSFMIEISNGILWACSEPKLDWQIGDNLELDFGDEEWELKNLRNSEIVDATIIYPEEIDLPTVRQISKNGKKIVLSDESVWFTRYSSFRNWQEGNRILVSPLNEVYIDTRTHFLINIDKSAKDGGKNYSSATLVK